MKHKDTTSLQTPEAQTTRFYRDMVIMLCAPLVMAVYYYGLRVLVLAGVCVLTAVVCEFTGLLLMRRKIGDSFDFHCVFVGLVIALMLPATAPLSLGVTGASFAIIAAKLPFGNARGTLFVSPAAGFAFLCVCWPTLVFDYPPIGGFGASVAAFQTVGSSLTSMLSTGYSLRLTIIHIFDILSGNVPGPMGTGSILVLIAASSYLLIRRPGALLNTLGYLAGCAVMAAVFPRVQSGRLSSVFLELCSGMLFFTAVFLLTDPATSPKKPLYRFYYGLFAGVLCMLLRYFGAYEEGACFALLIANALWPFAESRLDKLKIRLTRKTRTPVTPNTARGGVADA